MSVVVERESIFYGEETTITVSGLYNIIFNEDSSIISVSQTATTTYVAIVKPTISTIYYYTGTTADQLTYSSNVTVYVRVTPLNRIVTTNFNTPITLTVFGCSSYFWYPSTYLNQTSGSTVISNPLESIKYYVDGTDQFNTVTRIAIEVIVESGLIFTPSNPVVYDGNLLNLTVKYIGNPFANFSWKSNLFSGLKPYCVNLQYGDNIKINPYNNVSYKVDAFFNNSLITSGNIDITVIEKPVNIIDIDILPTSISNLVLTRDKKGLIKELIKNKILSKKLISFYYTTLQTAYRMEFTVKNGIPFKVPWQTVYQIVNESNGMILSFKQQWKFFGYINSNAQSNFKFLLNTLNEIYLSTPQKIYITPIS
jgi:hypothetical protein